ncbi:hypothetical protein RJ639_010122 [Escallonia herrerae]|uniref:GBF-interacting protein 1 N-terminal domain-containing protein n=1 Tax=Escallonia herrerae TaxID=1293975 RepID=A0AA88VPX1_9ASTE|nr:hypothetical protein RJ639_010122 [Escallonia herrerae]
MVAGAPIDGGKHILSAGVLKTIKQIKEVVVDHSDADIYVTLKETNMDPNETTQKLLNQEPFHEVKRRRDKKKEGTGYKGSTAKEPIKHTGYKGSTATETGYNGSSATETMKHAGYKVPTATEPIKHTGYKASTATEPIKHTEHIGQGMKFNTFSDRNGRRGVYNRNSFSGVSREFRVVKDNRKNQNANRETKPPLVENNELEISKASEKSSTGTTSHLKAPVVRLLSQSSNRINHSQHPRQDKEAYSSGNDLRNVIEERRSQSAKANNSQPQTTSSSNSVVGVYSSSSDPVHVPSLDSRAAANVGAIKREVGVVGVRRQSSENSTKISSAQTSSLSNSQLGRDGSSREFRSLNTTPKSDPPSQTTVPESTMTTRSFLNNQYGTRTHQQLLGHQKAAQPNKEWKPKSSQKPSTIGPGVIGSPAKSVSPADKPKSETEEAQSQSRVNVCENQNVIIAAHIRVSETDRSQLTFGTLGTQFESTLNSGFQAVGIAEESYIEPSSSLSASAPESSSDEASGSKQVDSTDEHARNSESNSTPSPTVSEDQLEDRKESSSPQNLDSYADIGLVRDNSSSYTHSESQQHLDPPELPSFSTYDPQTGYDIPYFRPPIDDSVRGQGLLSPQEALSSHVANSIPVSTIAMLQQQQQQQQQQQVAQMYPQVHVSHYANLMPYRQFLSPVYVPPMAMPGYSSNPAYPHPSNGSSYLLMPGGSSHLTASGVKYGIQQYKPVPSGSPTGFGNFTSPTGYAINAPGVVGSATGHDDPSRLKYKDGNLYIPNPQAETSEVWLNPRDLPSLQSPSYYNMPGQSPHAAYLPSHTGHASFNAAAAAAQSSHMQFPGLYHPPPQPAAIASPHHLGPAMGGNVGVAAAAPGAQVGAYQQPQLGHMNWTGNF